MEIDNKPTEKTYTLENLTVHDLNTISTGLLELPAKYVNELINRIQVQINEQEHPRINAEDK